MQKYVDGRYEEMTEDEIVQPEPISLIMGLKQLLAETDYKAIKYAEGALTEEEYEPIRQQRQAWRDEINRLESELDV